MADERSEIRRIHWGEVFSFTQIFRSFKLAIHPSKLVLGVAAIMLVFLVGAGMDWIWCWSGKDAKFTDGISEVQDYVTDVKNPEIFQRSLADWKQGQARRAGSMLSDIRSNSSDPRFLYSGLGQPVALASETSSDLYAFRSTLEAKVGTRSGQLPQPGAGPTPDYTTDPVATTVKRIREDLRTRDQVLLSAIEEARDAREAEIKDAKKASEADRKTAREQLRADYATALSNLSRQKLDDRMKLENVTGTGIFDSFSSFEWSCLANGISAVASGNFLGGAMDYSGAAPAGGLGLVHYVLQAMYGLKWLMAEHWLFAIIFLLLSLAIWALFGGAIHRIAALQAAHEEKISAVQALRFAASKWVSFITAPLIPVCVILFLGGLIVLGGLIANIPVVAR